MSHFIKYCTVCKKVISQCRCPSTDKQVQYGICDECLALQKKKESEESYDIGIQRYAIKHHPDHFDYLTEDCEGDLVKYEQHINVVKKACEFYDELVQKVRANEKFDQELISLLVDIKQDYLVRMIVSDDNEAREFVKRIKNYIFQYRNKD